MFHSLSPVSDSRRAAPPAARALSMAPPLLDSPRAPAPSAPWNFLFFLGLVAFLAIAGTRCVKEPKRGYELWTAFTRQFDHPDPPYVWGWDYYGVQMMSYCTWKQGRAPALYPPKPPEKLEEAAARGAELLARHPEIWGFHTGIYVYPPVVAVVFAPLSAGVGDRPATAFRRWMILSRALMIALALGAAWMAWRLWGRWGLADWAVTALMLLFYYPVWWGVIECSNAGVLMSALVAYAGLCLILPRPWMFGALFALSIQFKLSPILFLPWLVMRRRWKELAATVVFSAVWLAIALVFAGWKNHWEFARVILPWFGAGEVFYPNQSLNALIRRLMEDRYYFLFTHEAAPEAVARATRWASLGVIALTYGALAALAFRRPTRERLLLEYSLLCVSGLLASPISWEHHYANIFFVWVILYGALRYRLAGWRRWAGVFLFWPGFLLAASYFPVYFSKDVWTRLWVSYRMFSLAPALILIFLAHAAARPAEPGDEENAPGYDDWDTLYPGGAQPAGEA